MSLGNTTEDGDKTLWLQPETSEISSLLIEFPANTNVLVVDTNITTSLHMKKVMKQYAYQVTVYSDAEEALAFLINCKHEINIVIWDFHMPVINGSQALKIIGSKMDLPVIIMSDDNRPESVMKATIHGACDYVMKPVRKEILANIWQHIVRKRLMSKAGLTQPVQLDVVHNDDGLRQEKDDSMTVDQGNDEQNIEMIEDEAAKTWIREIQAVQSDNGLDLVNEDSMTVSQNNDEQDIDKKKKKTSNKRRMAWTKDLQQKFLKAVDLLGGPKRANPKALLKCLQEMKVTGLTRSNVSSHLQKHRLSLAEEQIPQQMGEIGWSSAYRTPPFLGGDNGLTASSSVTNGLAMYPFQENQYQNGYMGMNNNQFMTNTMPGLPYDHHFQQQQQLEQQQYQLEQQQYQLAHQLNHVMGNNEPVQASGIDLTDLEAIYPSLPYDPNECGYNFNQ